MFVPSDNFRETIVIGSRKLCTNDQIIARLLRKRYLLYDFLIVCTRLLLPDPHSASSWCSPLPPYILVEDYAYDQQGTCAVVAAHTGHTDAAPPSMRPAP